MKGQYMKKLNKDERSRIMRERAFARWNRSTSEKKIAVGAFLKEARRKKGLKNV